ncbi:hypothetical protein I7I48_04779 [Histoplasma ohiense]|nr:hypothetical protein I7I48_04779 [Histoplasma ohiense (nom. inval.)]
MVSWFPSSASAPPFALSGPRPRLRSVCALCWEERNALLSSMRHLSRRFRHRDVVVGFSRSG